MMGIQRSLKAEKRKDINFMTATSTESFRERFFTRLHYSSARLTTDERRGLPHHVSSLLLAAHATVVTRAILELRTTLIHPRRTTNCQTPKRLEFKMIAEKGGFGNRFRRSSQIAWRHVGQSSKCVSSLEQIQPNWNAKPETLLKCLRRTWKSSSWLEDRQWDNSPSRRIWKWIFSSLTRLCLDLRPLFSCLSFESPQRSVVNGSSWSWQPACCRMELLDYIIWKTARRRYSPRYHQDNRSFHLDIPKHRRLISATRLLWSEAFLPILSKSASS